MGPKKRLHLLNHGDRDVFYYAPPGEMAAGFSTVTFTVGPDQQTLQVVIENLDVEGQGTFTHSANSRP